MKKRIIFIFLLIISVAVFSSCRSSGRSRGEEDLSADTVQWPSAVTLRGFGLEELTQPQGTTVTSTVMHMGYYIIGLSGGGRAAFDNLIEQIALMPGSSLVTEARDSGAQLMGFMMPTGNVVNILIELENGDISIQALPAG